jgi:hypothetical protein
MQLSLGPCPLPPGIDPARYKFNPLLDILDAWPGHKIVQTLIVQLVRERFEYAGWVVYEEFEYAWDVIPTNPHQEIVRKVLEEEMRKSKVKAKPDISMISADGDYLDVAEIGTGPMRHEKQSQLYDRLIWWQHCLSKRRIACLVRPLDWRPPRGIIGTVEGCLICTEPTWRERAPDGVILYEIHKPADHRVPVPLPVELPDLKRLRADSSVVTELRHAHPELSDELGGHAIPQELLGVVIVVAAFLMAMGLPLLLAAEMAVTLIVKQGEDPNAVIQYSRMT